MYLLFQLSSCVFFEKKSEILFFKEKNGGGGKIVIDIVTGAKHFSSRIFSNYSGVSKLYSGEFHDI